MKIQFAFLTLGLLSLFQATAQDVATTHSINNQHTFLLPDHHFSTASLNVGTAVPNLRRDTYNNRLGLGVDATFFNLSSTDVDVTGKTGWSANFETRGDFRPDFDMIYSIGIFNHQFAVREQLTNEEIDMNMLGVEIKFLLAWKVAKSDYFSIEAGPALMLNGELKVKDDRFEEALLGSATNPVSMEEFQNTSPLNLNGVIGFSGGIRDLRITAHYHYAFFNALTGNSVAGDELDGNFSYFSAGLRFYF